MFFRISSPPGLNLRSPTQTSFLTQRGALPCVSDPLLSPLTNLQGKSSLAYFKPLRGVLTLLVPILTTFLKLRENLTLIQPNLK